MNQSEVVIAIDHKITELLVFARQLDRNTHDKSVLKDSILSFCNASGVLLSRVKRCQHTKELPFPESDGHA